MDCENRGYVSQTAEVFTVRTKQAVKSRVPVVQVNNIGRCVHLIYPGCGDRTEERKFVGVRCIRATVLVTAVDLAWPMRREIRMFENDIAHFGLAARNLKGIDGFDDAAKAYLDGTDSFRTRQSMKHAVGRCEDSCFPGKIGKCCGQVTHDIAYAADLAAAKCPVFCCQKNDVLFSDGGRPGLSCEVQCLAEHVRGNERQSALCHTKTAFAIVIVIHSNLGAVGNDSAGVDDCVFYTAIAADIHIGQNHGSANAAVRPDRRTGKQQ
jgi:hypothetical protein